MGGINALERDFKSRWQRGFSSATQKLMSRMKLIVKSLKHIGGDNKRDNGRSIEIVTNRVKYQESDRRDRN